MSEQQNESMSESLIELWPTTILRKTLEDYQQVNVDLIGLFDQYQADHPQPGKSGYISPDNFSDKLENPTLNRLKQFIMDGVYEISRSLNETYWQQFKLQSLNVDVTGLWFQISNDYTFHETHIHGNCSWSGVYYVQAGSVSRSQSDPLPNGMPNGVTRFYGPGMEYSAGGHGDWGNYYLHHNAYTSYPQDGVMVIFPSHIKHMAFPYFGEQDRVIVSFHAQVNSDTEIVYDYSYD